VVQAVSEPRLVAPPSALSHGAQAPATQTPFRLLTEQALPLVQSTAPSPASALESGPASPPAASVLESGPESPPVPTVESGPESPPVPTVESGPESVSPRVPSAAESTPASAIEPVSAPESPLELLLELDDDEELVDEEELVDDDDEPTDTSGEPESSPVPDPCDELPPHPVTFAPSVQPIRVLAVNQPFQEVNERMPEPSKARAVHAPVRKVPHCRFRRGTDNRVRERQ
jgi:hypothetical protein